MGINGQDKCRANVRIDFISKSMTDDEIRKAVLSSNFINRSYMEWICRNCGMYSMPIDGDTSQAIIKDVCSHCFDEENG